MHLTPLNRSRELEPCKYPVRKTKKTNYYFVRYAATFTPFQLGVSRLGTKIHNNSDKMGCGLI